MDSVEGKDRHLHSVYTHACNQSVTNIKIATYVTRDFSFKTMTSFDSYGYSRLVLHDPSKIEHRSVLMASDADTLRVSSFVFFLPRPVPIYAELFVRHIYTLQQYNTVVAILDRQIQEH